jgi:hypothetical protein
MTGWSIAPHKVPRMPTTHQRVTDALDQLTMGMVGFVEKHLKATYGDGWIHAARDSFRDERGGGGLPQGEVVRWDAAAVLTIIWDQWNRVFKHVFGPLERSLVSELRDFRNRWAHQDRFEFDDAYRTLDSVERLLRSAEATPQAERVAREKRDLMRQEVGRETRNQFEKAKTRRRMIQDLVLYAVCWCSVVFASFHSMGTGAWLVAVFAAIVFGFLAWQRTSAAPPAFFGAHECPQCTKIIYGENCPYCDPALAAKPAKRPAAAVAVASHN